MKKINTRTIFLCSMGLFFLFLPFSVAPKNLFMVTTIFIGFIYIFKDASLKIEVDLINVALILLVASLFASSFIAGDSFADSFKVNKDILRMALVFLVIRSIRLGFIEFKNYFVLPLLVSFVIVFGIGFYESFILDISKDGRFRMMGPVNRSAVYMLLILSLSFSLVFMKKIEKKYKSILSAVAFVAAIGVLISASRSAWAILLLLTLLVPVYYRFNKKMVASFLLVAVASVIAVYAFDPTLFVAKMNVNAFYRLGIWNAGLDYYFNKANILFGIGSSHYDIIDLAPYTGGKMASNIQSHNMYIKFLVENGLVGLLSFLLFVTSSFVFMVKNRFNSKEFYLVGWTVFISMLASSMFHNSIYREFGMLFFIMIGLSLSQLTAMKSESLMKQ